MSTDGGPIDRRTDGRTDTLKDGQDETNIPPPTSFAGGGGMIIKCCKDKDVSHSENSILFSVQSRNHGVVPGTLHYP